MADVMMAFGTYAFSIDTAAYDELTRQTGWKWTSLPRIGNTPMLQYVGKEADTITLDGTIYTERAGLDQLEELRKIGDSKKPQLLVDQYGYIHSKWCLESITEKKSGFFSDGAARKQRFSIKLISYQED